MTSRPIRSKPLMTPFSRRTLLRGVGVGALGLTMPQLLAACGGSSADLVFSNWPEYIDIDEESGEFPTLKGFEDEFDLKVAYQEDVNDNVEFFGKVKDQLAAGDPIGRDLVTLTDWMAAKWITNGFVEKLDRSALPNVEANLLDNLRSPGWDAARDYSVPWQSGFTGIAYNASLTGEVRTFEELVTRSDLKGKITLLTEMRDTMGFFLKLVGKDPDNFSDADFDLAVERLSQVVGTGQVRAFTGNEYIGDLEAGNIVACEAWSGDVAASENPDIKFIVPQDTGLSIWSDNLMVPQGAENKANAEKLINYYYDPEVAATLAAYVWYVCPVKGAQEAMADIDESLVDNPLIFPTADFLEGTWLFQSIDEATETKYQTAFDQASAG